MAKISMDDYRAKYLQEVEKRLLARKETIPHFTTHLLSDAIRAEMTRADADTWEIEVPDDRERAMGEAEQRILEFMRLNRDLGVGKGA